MTAITELRLADIMTQPVETIPPEAALESAARRMAEARVSSLVVTRDARPIGILTARDLASLRAKGVAFTTPVAEVMARALVSASPDQDVCSTYVRLRREGIRHMVVADGAGELVGLATETDLYRHLGSDLLQRLAHPEALIERDIPRLGPGDTLAQAIACMSAQGKEFVLVVDAERPVGILTERDLPPLLAQPVESMQEVSLAEVMRAPLVTLVRGASMAEALDLMERHRIRHLPVLVEPDGALLGVLSQHRLLECLGPELLDHTLQEQQDLRRLGSDLESRLDLALEAAGMGVWEYDHARGLNHWDDRLCRMLGYDRAPPSVQDWLELVHPRDRSGVLDRVQESLAGADYRAEYRLRHGNGDWLWCESRGRVVRRDAQGAPLLTAGIQADISERRQAEEALRRSEARLKEAQRIARVGHWEVDPAGPVLVWSEEMYRLTGFDPAQGPPSWESYLQWVHPEDRDRVQEAQREVLHTGKATRTELRNDPAKGPLRHFIRRVEPELDAAGRVVRLVGTCQDVTDLQQAKAQARRSDAMLDSVFQAIPDLFFLMDGDGTVLDYRAQRRSDLYVPPEQFLGRRLQDVLPARLAEVVVEKLQAALGQDGPVCLESDLDTPSGDHRYEARLSRLGDSGQCVAVVRDITEQHRARQALAESEQRYSLAAAIGRSGAWELWPLEGRLFFDHNLVRIMGYDRGDLSENLADWLAIIPQDGRARVEDALQAIIEGRSDALALEHPVRRKDGSPGWIYLTGERVSALGEEPMRLVGSSLDITTRKQIETERDAQLAELRRWHEAMLGREARVLELKREVNRLLAELGRPPRYTSVADPEAPPGDG